MATRDHGTGPSEGPPPERRVGKPDMVNEVHGNGIPFSIKSGQIEVLCEHLRDGSSMNAALMAAGISWSTHYEWMLKGADPKSRDKNRIPEKYATEPYLSYARAVRLAEAESERYLVKKIKKASDQDWRAASWLLSRRFPDDWGERKPADVGVEVDADAEHVSVKVYLPSNGRELVEEDDAVDEEEGEP